jgi:hypothetical protein
MNSRVAFAILTALCLAAASHATVSTNWSAETALPKSAPANMAGGGVPNTMAVTTSGTVFLFYNETNVVTNTAGKNIVRWMRENLGVEVDPHAHDPDQRPLYLGGGCGGQSDVMQLLSDLEAGHAPASGFYTANLMMNLPSTRLVQPVPAPYPGRQFPAVAALPGGTGAGAPLADNLGYRSLASNGFVVACFNPEGRGTGQPGNRLSQGVEDCNGYVQQRFYRGLLAP